MKSSITFTARKISNLSNIQNISNYQEFVNLLQQGYNSFLTKPQNEWVESALKYVDGFAAQELRRLVDLDTRRKYGTFFTDSKLAEDVLNVLQPTFDSHSVIYDPACGAGNLLIAAENYLQKKKIRLNNEKYLLGTDLHKEFIEAARLRLLINKMLFPKEDTANKMADFENFSFNQSNGLHPNSFYEKSTHVIVNPPFNLVSEHTTVEWTKGKVSSAALFIDNIIQNVNVGVPIYAILPDVLRSGSRYEKWREYVQKKCIVGKIKTIGQFDKYADIDVFAISLIKRRKNFYRINTKNPWKSQLTNSQKTIIELFDVCVGPVVDNRDEHTGAKREYIISKGLKGWSTQSMSPITRKFKGKAFESPFVVIKRTSRMGDSFRATATIINSLEPVYVDNHLIVVQPKSKRMKDCVYLLENLKDCKTNDWLNDQIRCRHLTVKVVSNIPLWK